MQHERLTLKNGLRLILAPRVDIQTATALVLVAAGSHYEKKEENGISHFLEHLCFKGTARRLGPLAIARELDSLGAVYNAFTGTEYTGYFAKVPSRHALAALDIITDLYQNPTLPPEEIEREKGVIIEEMRMYEDLPHKKVHDVLEELLYGDQPAGRSVLGTAEGIRAMTREMISTYRSELYVPSNTLIVVTGNFDAEAVRTAVTTGLGALGARSARVKPAVHEEQHEFRARALTKELDQLHVALGFRTFPIRDARVPALAVLATVLGGTMSSRLWQRVREELGAAYYVWAAPAHGTDHGTLTIGAGIDVGRAEEVLRAITQECLRIREDGISSEELARAQDSLVGKLYLGLERSDDVADFYAFQELLKGESDDPAIVEAKIRAVGAGDVASLAREIFVAARANAAAIGPLTEGEALLARACAL